jgi:hypothetical protein
MGISASSTTSPISDKDCKTTYASVVKRASYPKLKLHPTHQITVDEKARACLKKLSASLRDEHNEILSEWSKVVWDAPNMATYISETKDLRHRLELWQMHVLAFAFGNTFDSVKFLAQHTTDATRSQMCEAATIHDRTVADILIQDVSVEHHGYLFPHWVAEFDFTALELHFGALVPRVCEVATSISKAASSSSSSSSSAATTSTTKDSAKISMEDALSLWNEYHAWRRTHARVCDDRSMLHNALTDKQKRTLGAMYIEVRAAWRPCVERVCLASLDHGANALLYELHNIDLTRLDSTTLPSVATSLRRLSEIHIAREQILAELHELGQSQPVRDVLQIEIASLIRLIPFPQQMQMGIVMHTDWNPMIDPPLPNHKTREALYRISPVLPQVYDDLQRRVRRIEELPIEELSLKALQAEVDDTASTCEHANAMTIPLHGRRNTPYVNQVFDLLNTVDQHQQALVRHVQKRQRKQRR